MVLPWILALMEPKKQKEKLRILFILLSLFIKIYIFVGSVIAELANEPTDVHDRT